MVISRNNETTASVTESNIDKSLRKKREREEQGRPFVYVSRDDFRIVDKGRHTEQSIMEGKSPALPASPDDGSGLDKRKRITFSVH